MSAAAVTEEDIKLHEERNDAHPPETVMSPAIKQEVGDELAETLDRSGVNGNCET